MHNYIEAKIVIENFLEELKQLLADKELKFDIISSQKNKETLLELNYNSEDIKIELMKLGIEQYVESVPDTRDGIILNVFSKTIKNKQVYIKVKIRSKENKKVLCLSFHFAEHKINFFPYK